MIGKTLGGYRILEQAGAGGMATVWKAYDPGTDRIIALKTLPHQYSSDPSFRARFEQEARAIARLEHLHILPVFAYGEEDGIAYMAMRYLDTGTLSRLIHSRVLPLEEVARLLHQIASALDYAHQHGILHRDVKPSNVLIDADGNAFLTDFGIAKIVEGGLGLTGSALIGTPQYMSPEQCLGQKDLTPAADQYSLGVMLYEMVTGHTPYQAETPVAIIQKHIVGEALPLPAVTRPDLPESAQQVILKALAREPNERYETCTALAQAFIIALRTAPMQPRSTPAASASAQEAATLVDVPDSPQAPTTSRDGQPSAVALAPAASASRLPLAWILVAVLLVAVVIVALLILGQEQRDGVGQAAVASATFTEAAPPSATFTPDQPPTPATPLARARRDLELRAGPGPDFAALTTLASGDELEITGISSDGRWYEVLLPDGRRGWLIASSAMTELLGSAAVLPSIVPPTLTPSATHTPEPSATLTVTHTPEPSATPTATHTQEPSATPTDAGILATQAQNRADLFATATARAAIAEEMRFLVPCGPLDRRLCILGNQGQVLEEINPGLPAGYLDISSTNWSSDGAFAIFAARYGDDRHRIMRYDFATAALHILTDGERNDLGPALSPDDRLIIFHSNCDTHLINADGSNRQELLFHENRWCPYLFRWSPDGRSVALLSFTPNTDNPVHRQVHVMRDGDPATLRRILVMRDEGHGAHYDMVWTPNGTALLVQLARERLRIAMRCWTTDCDEYPRVNLTAELPASWQPYAHPRTTQAVSAPSSESWAKRSESRYLVACGPLDRRLCILNSQGEQIEQINPELPAEYLNIGGINWSRDGTFAIFHVRYRDLRHQIMRYDFTTATLSNLTGGTVYNNEVPALSPNGQWIAFQANCAVHVIRLDGHNRRVLRSWPGRCAMQIRWSPDGQTLFALFAPTASQGAGIVLALPFGRDGTELRLLYQPGLERDGDWNLHVSPDGTELRVQMPGLRLSIDVRCITAGCRDFPASEEPELIFPAAWGLNVQPHWTEQRP